MRRLFWLGVGIAVGALVVRQVAKTAHAYTPAGLASSARNSAAGLLGSVQDFIADVREGMAEREQQIHEAFLAGESLTDVDDFGELESRMFEHGDLDGFGELESRTIRHGEIDDTRPR